MCRVLCALLLAVSALAGVRGLNDIFRATQPLYGMSTFSDRLQDNATCKEDLDILRKAVDDEEVWAIKAMDASGRPEAGFVYGNNLWIGSHGQCKDISNTKPLEINHEKIGREATAHEYPPYTMGFTMVYLRHNSTLQHHTQLPLEWTIQLGLCVPKSCTKEDVGHLAKIYFDGGYLEMQKFYQASMEVIEVKQLRDDMMWFFMLPKTIIFFSISIVLILLTIVGTIYDVKMHNIEKNLVAGYNNGTNLNGKASTNISIVELVSKNSSTESLPRSSTLGEIIKCFSFYSNTKNLVKTKLSPDSVGCIHGLRFIGMLWVVAVHAVYYQADYIKNVPFAYRLSEDIFAQILSNATYCVDTYLFLSGFLVAYLYYSKKNPHEQPKQTRSLFTKTNEFFMMYINRSARLTPPYLFIILFVDVIYTLFRQFSSLMSSEMADVVCEKYWWRNLIYINNLFPRKEMCLSWSWYLSLDTQFFTVTTLLLILSLSAFKLTAVITFLLIFINIASTGYKSYMIGYIPTMDEQLVQLDAIYDLPWNRIGPYLVGAITGYILIVRLQQKLTLTKKQKAFGWTVFPLLNIWILFTLYTRKISVEFSAVYMGVSRTLWGVGMAWVLIACCTGNAQALQKFLSFRGFIPLSRLTYCAYLLNPLVANMIYLGSESAFNASLGGFALTICGITLLTFYLSYLFSVMIESPMILLTKMAFKRITRRTNPRDKPQGEN